MKLNITHEYESLQECKTQIRKVTLWKKEKVKWENSKKEEEINAERISITVQRNYSLDKANESEVEKKIKS